MGVRERGWGLGCSCGCGWGWIARRQAAAEMGVALPGWLDAARLEAALVEAMALSL